MNVGDIYLLYSIIANTFQHVNLAAAQSPTRQQNRKLDHQNSETGKPICQEKRKGSVREPLQINVSHPNLNRQAIIHGTYSRQKMSVYSVYVLYISYHIYIIYIYL